MASFQDTWNPQYEAIPYDTDQVSLGASVIRDLKVNIRERMQSDHSWNGDGNDGFHDFVTLIPQAGWNPNSPAASPVAQIRGQQIGSFVELMYGDGGGNSYQFTSAGSLNPSYAFPSTIEQVANSGGTANIGSANTHIVQVTGGGTISSFGAANSQYPLYFINFNQATTLVNSSSLNLPLGQNLALNGSDWVIATCLYNGNLWYVFGVSRWNGQPLAPSGGYCGFQQWTSPGTFTYNPSPFAQTAIVYMGGGGGGGGGVGGGSNTVSAGGGGGSGGCLMGVLGASQQTVIIGGGGAGGGPSANGSGGGTTSFGGWSCGGGSGGQGYAGEGVHTTAYGGTAGSVSGGNASLVSAPGGFGLGIIASGNSVSGGNGGSAYFGSGGRGGGCSGTGAQAVNGQGGAATAGGGGAAQVNSGGGASGGAGGAGVVQVFEFSNA